MAAEPRRKTRWRDATLMALALVSITVYVVGGGLMGDPGFPLDDAWIHQTYARNLAQSSQWAFVPGEPSAGSTAPLYTLLLSAGYLLGIPFLLWTTVLGGLALAAAGLIAARLGECLLPEQRTIGWWAGLATVFSWHLIWAGASGMETMLFAAQTLVLVWLAWRELDADAVDWPAALRRGGLLGIFGAAATLTRPEGAGLVGLIGLMMWIARPGDGWRRNLAWSLGVGLGWLVGFVPYALLNVSLGGGILPNTAAAKQAENLPLLTLSFPGRVINLLFPLVAGGQLLLVPGMIAATGTIIRQTLHKRQVMLLLVPVLWAAALVGLYATRLPAPYQHGRYVIPALPHLILLGVVGTAQLWKQGSGTPGGRVLSRGVAFTAIILFVLFWGVGLQQYGTDVQIIQSEMVAASQWLAENITTDQLLAVHDIGAVGYYAPRPILDLAGLVSPEVIPIIRDWDALWALMEARGARYLMALPDQIPGQDENDPRLCQVYTTGGTWSPAMGGANMTIYALAWNEQCP